MKTKKAKITKREFFQGQKLTPTQAMAIRGGGGDDEAAAAVIDNGSGMMKHGV